MFAAFTMPTDSQWAEYNSGHGESTLQRAQENKLEEWWNGQMHAKFPGCSASHHGQRGGNQQASISHAPVEEQLPEMVQQIATAQGTEEMEMQDRDSEHGSAEGPCPTGTQSIGQNIELQEASPCNARAVQEQEIEPRPSTSRGIQEPVCKKSKRGPEEQHPTSAYSDISSEEGDMSETQSAEEWGSLEGSEPLSTPEAPPVYLERVQSWQRPLQHYRAIEYYERYRFVNMEHVQSFTLAIDVIHNEIQNLLNRISRDISPNDFVQLRLDAEELSRPLFSVRRHLEELDADEFLSYVESLLQSNVEILWRNSLELTVTIVKNHEGGGLRKLGTVLFSKILEKKRQHLIDFNVEGVFLCFAGSLLSLLDNEMSSKQEIITRATDLHNTLGISTSHRIDFSQIHLFEDHFGITIKIVFYHEGGWRFFVTGGTLEVRVVFMLLHDSHYYGIKNIKGFMGVRYFCILCHTAYHHKFRHDCQYFCRACTGSECREVAGGRVRCRICKLLCRSNACLERHEQLAVEGKIGCEDNVFCSKCGIYVPAPHVECKKTKCGQCGAKVDSLTGHLCYLKRLFKPVVGYMYIVYDFECCQETGAHIPNYVYAMDMLDDGDVRKWEWYGDKCLEEFVKTFVQPKFKGVTFIAHNSKSYDGYLVLRQLIREKVKVQLLTQGGKLLCITLPHFHIRFIDSLSFLPMKLSKLPKAMGFQGSKGYFPHLFNTAENQDYVGTLPDIKYYSPDTMMPGEKEEFEKWHAANKGTTFNLKKDLAYYCKQDVKILRDACNRFREQVMEMTKREFFTGRGGDILEESEIRCIDPFQYVTLASICMAQYRFMFLKKDNVALAPLDNYQKSKKSYSACSVQWLMYIEHTEGINIQHALQGGEKQVGVYFLDGFAVINGSPTAFEFYGCFFHGCPICYKAQDFNNLLDSTYGLLYSRTRAREEYLKSLGYVVRIIWEHEWNDMLKNNEGLKHFLVDSNFPTPLNPRDAFFGGRTNATCLYYKPKQGEQILYYDFTSLYPFVNKNKLYPTGHPEIIYQNFGDIKQYFGFAKVKVYTPRGLYFPVLPYKSGGKLMFSLCATCTEKQQVTECLHNDEERALTGTWCTVELNVAVEKGYRIAEIYEVWHFERKSKTLFSGYINMHLRQKQEASGYPVWCKTEEDKERYVRDYEKNEGVRLRKERIEVNPAKRQIAKLFLNSLWGKFGQSTTQLTTSVVTEPEELFKYLFVPHYEVSSCEFVDDETAIVTWKTAKKHPTKSTCTNLFIACFTTAYARLELYRLLDRLGDRCLYHDTDSVIFISREGAWSPALGDYLGQLTSEIPPNTSITEFVAVGPKTYGYALSNGSTVLKVKGITLNSSNCVKVNFESLKDLIDEYCQSEGEEKKEIKIQQPGIVRIKKQWALETRVLRKTLKVVYNKRVLKTEDYCTLPYGY
ncbi:uncharacterized protein LOC117657823 [Pantherophis guttatus]|uniref:DNA-directed DNA polymerase n=1 Tax=Pantherophis guttatus TaxID=94885 RepID=A0ABM3ZQI1_PANGU|nr:uncharacterized protein LOC117657823 [Pantherophis guttatus]